METCKVLHKGLIILTAAVCATAYSYSASAAQGTDGSCVEDYQPDPDCTKFWRCANGKLYPFTCPGGLHFNEHIHVCDWPENANCKGNAGGGGSPYEGSNAGYDSNDDDDSYEDALYPYQPGTAAPKYYEEEEYYTEAPRAARTPLYRPVPTHNPRPVYRPVSKNHHDSDNDYRSGQRSNYGGGSDKNYGSRSSKSYDSGSGKSYDSGSGKSYGTGSGSSYGSGVKNYDSGSSRKYGSGSSNSYGSGSKTHGHGGQSGNSHGGNGNNDYKANSDYGYRSSDSGRHDSGQDYHGQRNYGSGRNDYDSGRNHDDRDDSYDRHDSGRNYDSSRGSYKNPKSDNTGKYGGYDSNQNYNSNSNSNSNNNNNFQTKRGVYSGPQTNYNPMSRGGYPTGGNFGAPMGGGFSGGNFGAPINGNFGGHMGGNFASRQQPPLNYPSSFNKQPLPWMAQQQRSNFAAGFGGRAFNKGPVGGIPVQPLGKQSFGPQLIGGQSFNKRPVGGIPVQPLGKQPFGPPPIGGQFLNKGPVGGIPVYPLGSQTIGGKPFFGPQPIGGKPFIGPQPIGGKPFIGLQPIGGKPFIGPQLIGGKPFIGPQPIGGKPFFGTQPIGGSIVVKQPVGPIPLQGSGLQLGQITLGKPSVGVSSLGKAFIPVIQKNPQLSKIFGQQGSGYLQFNPLAQSQPVVMNDYGLGFSGWGTGLSGHGTGTLGMMNIGRPGMMNIGRPGMMNIGRSGMMNMGRPGMMNIGGPQMMNMGGSGMMMGQPMVMQQGGGGLSKVLLPIKFVTSSASTTTASTTSTTTASTTTGSTTVATRSAPVNIFFNPLFPPSLPLPLPGGTILPGGPIPVFPSRAGQTAGGGPTARSLLSNVLQDNRDSRVVSALQNPNSLDFSHFATDPSSACTARQGPQRITMPLVQQSGNALKERKCNALGKLINAFVNVFVEHLPAQSDGSCVIQVPEIRVTCNTGSTPNIAFSG